MSRLIPSLGHLLIGQPEIAERMMRALSLKGALPQHIDGDYDPMILVEDLTRPEYLYLRRELQWSAGLAQVAVAGERGVVAIGPKPGALGTRPVIAVVDNILIENIAGVATSFRYGLLSTAQAGSALMAGAGAPRDDRVAGAANNQSILGVGVGSNAVDPTTFTNSPTVRLAIDQSIVVPGPWILTGAIGPTASTQMLLGVWGSVVNQAVQATFNWRERTPLATELI